MKFKYLDISRRTARRNPEMVKREYKRIIEEQERKIENISKQADKLQIEVLIEKGAIVPTIEFNEFIKLYFDKESLDVAKYQQLNVENLVLSLSISDFSVINSKNEISIDRFCHMSRLQRQMDNLQRGFEGLEILFRNQKDTFEIFKKEKKILDEMKGEHERFRKFSNKKV